MTKIFAIAAGILSLAGAAAAQDVTIRYGDLDLSTETGAATLRSRVAAAAYQFCASDAASTAYPHGNPRLCERRFQQEAMRQLPAARQADLAVAARSDILVAAR